MKKIIFLIFAIFFISGCTKYYTDTECKAFLSDCINEENFSVNLCSEEYGNCIVGEDYNMPEIKLDLDIEPTIEDVIDNTSLLEDDNQLEVKIVIENNTTENESNNSNA